VAVWSRIPISHADEPTLRSLAETAVKLLKPLHIKDGMAIPSSRSGDGLAWDGDVAAKYRLT
jgi:hypothetical protein